MNISQIEQNKNSDSLKGNYVGCIPQNNDFIIYGIDSNYLTFLSLSQNINYKLLNYDKISEKISCKFIEINEFICASIYQKKINIVFFNYNIDNSYKTLSFINNIPEETNKNFINLALYDTNISTIKILCKQDGGNLDINCDFFQIETGKRSITKYRNKINFRPSSNDFSEKDCSLSEFNDEYLFCCGIINSIKCFRLNLVKGLTIIKKFEIGIDERNTYLTIRVDNLCASIFFMNNNKNVYEYLIYKPECNNIIFERNYDEDIEETFEERISNLFIVKTYNYYFKLNKLYGIYNNKIEMDISLNSEKLDFGKKVNILDNEYNIYFSIIKREGDLNYFYINYDVSIGNDKDDFYSQQCKIEFKLDK